MSAHGEMKIWTDGRQSLPWEVLLSGAVLSRLSSLLYNHRGLTQDILPHLGLCFPSLLCGDTIRC